MIFLSNELRWTKAFILLMALSLSSPSAVSAKEGDASGDVQITLQRSACFGSCPDYEVTLFANGRIRFVSEPPPIDQVAGLHRAYAFSAGVLLPGTHEDSVSPQVVAKLADRFRRAKFFALRDEYRARVTDMPSYVLTFEDGHRRKSVVDYAGRETGMPKLVSELEEAVDLATGAARWVHGDERLISWLEQTGFDFSSQQAAELAVAGVRGQANEAMILMLVDRGAPLSDSVSVTGLWSNRSAPVVTGMALIEGAIDRGQAKLFTRLQADGWLDRLGPEKAARLFARWGAGCSPLLVDAFVAAGIDIDMPQPKDPDATWEAGGKSALIRVAASHQCDTDAAVRLQTANRLLSHGADPNHRDDAGRTSLYGVRDVPLLDLLLRHGADPRVKGEDGYSMIFGSWDEPVILRLLEAGASPAGRYNNKGISLLDQARKTGMRKVIAWLKAHPEAMAR